MGHVLILADDLTGAADCAAAFLGSSTEVVVALDERRRLRAPVLAIDLDTRNLSEEAACARAGGFGGPDTLVHCVARLKR
ncbi:MAG: four-carbon acid sugar kinase family protein, partial [Burkholderiales bacterium]